MYSNYPSCSQKGWQAIFNIFYTRQNIQSKSISVNILTYNVCTFSIFSAIYHGENKLMFNEMMMRSALYYTNTLSYIFMVLAHWNNSPRVHIAPLGHIIPIPSQPVFALTSECCMLNGEATNTNFIVLHILWFDPTGARTYDLPRRAR